MGPYHKIDTVYKRDPANLKRLIIGDYSNPAFEYLAKCPWDWTEKVDGTNIRVIVKPRLLLPPESGIEFGGKTDNAQMPPKLLKKLEEMFFPLSDKLHEMFWAPQHDKDGTQKEPPSSVTLYGEGYGAGIQKGGGNYRQDQSFVLFDVLVSSAGGQSWWLERENILDVAVKLGLVAVPLVSRGTLEEMVEFARQGFPSLWGPFKAEGLVAKPRVGLFDRSGRRIITKIKYRDFDHLGVAGGTVGVPAST